MTSLSRFAPLAREPDPLAPRRLAKRAWHDRAKIIAIDPDWLSSWADRKQLEILAEKVHGPRKVKP
jgi:hypothetical protein